MNTTYYTVIEAGLGGSSLSLFGPAVPKATCCSEDLLHHPD